ncbi:MAG: hypothetical protein Q4F72_09755, partial [Desulfovibrionaceae bacterium]|nr:hypothetical protein [Desulfovibrionaceae bacterium]
AEDSELHELSMHWLEERAFHDPAKTPHLVSGFEALCALVSRGAGITILPESCLPRDRDAAIASGLLRIGPDLAAGSFTCCLVERQGAARSVQADVFRALVLSLDDDHAGKAADKTGSSARKAAPVSLRTRTADREIRVAGAKETIALAGGKTAGRTVVWADSAADRNAPTGEDPIIFNALPPGIPARSKRTTLRVRWKEAEHITAKERKLIYDEPEYAPAVARVLIAHPDPASLTRSGRWTAKVQVRHPVTGKSFSGHAGPSPEELEAARKPPAMGTLANNIWDALPVPGTDRYWAEHQRFEMIMRDDGFRDTTGTVPMLHVTDITGFVWVREGNEVYSGYLQDWAMDFQRLYREWLAAAGSSSKLSSIRREFRRLWYVPPTKAHPEGDDKNGFLNWLNAALLVSAWLRLGWMYPNGLDAEGKPAFPRDLPALQEITDRYGCKVQVRPSIFHTEDGLADTEQWLDFLRHPETYLVDFKLMPKRDKEQFRDVCLTIADAHDAIMLDHTEGADKNPYLSAFHTWVIDQGPAPDKGKSRRGRGRRQR